jgi:hypothetical protein
MVAPVQGTVGKTSNDPSTQDYLTELTNFYNKPENEGVESEFKAPDGSSFKIKDASYLARVRSNVNTGKYDAAAAQQQASANKAVDKNADTSLDNSDYSKDKQKGAKRVEDANNSASMSDSKNTKSKGSSKVSEGKDTVKSEQDQEAGLQAELEKSNTQTNTNIEATQVLFKKMTENAAKTKATTQVTLTKVQQAFSKAKKAREAQAQRAEETMSEDSSTQSGSKMGFEGKLMTTNSITSSNSSADAAMDKSWEETMNGKIKVSSDLLKTQVPQLQNVKSAGEKAAQPMLAQAKVSDSSADAQKQQRSQNITKGSVEVGVGAVGVTVGTVQIVTGTATWSTGTALLSNPYTAAAGGAMVASGKATVMSGAGQVLGGIGSIGSAIMGSFKAAKANKQAAEQFVKTAESQRTQSMTARRQAMALTQQSNAKIVKATQALNKTTQELSSGSLLSSSSYGGVNTDGMDESQIESVKQERYNKVMTHEQAHAAIIGGSPVVETDSNGVAIGGYVNIDVPTVDENDLQGTIAKAQKVIEAALAPSDPSSQDRNIASQARSVLNEAQSKLEEKSKKAEEDKKSEKTEDKKEEAKEEVKEEKTEQPKQAK